jgi:VRR-NUC domain
MKLASSEYAEQVALFEWVTWQHVAHPELRLLFHIPNGEKRPARTGARLRASGVRAGVPDLCLPVARGRYHGLFCELKSRHGRCSHAQRDWIAALQDEGYWAGVVRGWDEVRGLLLAYLALPRVPWNPVTGAPIGSARPLTNLRKDCRANRDRSDVSGSLSRGRLLDGRTWEEQPDAVR